MLSAVTAAAGRFAVCHGGNNVGSLRMTLLFVFTAACIVGAVLALIYGASRP
jgi:hypothetical protein